MLCAVKIDFFETVSIDYGNVVTKRFITIRWFVYGHKFNAIAYSVYTFGKVCDLLLTPTFNVLCLVNESVGMGIMFMASTSNKIQDHLN